MQPDHRARYTFGFALLAALLAALILWNLNTGSLHLSPAEVMDILLTRTGENAAIVWEMRLPRLIAAMLLGGALSISGFLLQTFFANPIAGPFVLGISSGAKLTVSLAMIGLLSRGRVIGSTGMILAAFCGAMLSMGFVLALAQRVRQMSLLIIAGVMVGYICSAVTDFVVTFAEDSNIVNLHNWSQGSFSGISWDNICVIAPVVLISLVVRSSAIPFHRSFTSKLSMQSSASPKASLAAWIASAARRYFLCRLSKRYCSKLPSSTSTRNALWLELFVLLYFSICSLRYSGVQSFGTL